MRKPLCADFLFIIARFSTHDYYFLWSRIIQNMFVTMQKLCICIAMIHDHSPSMNTSILNSSWNFITILFYKVLFSQTFLVGKIEECLENVGVWAWGGWASEWLPGTRHSPVISGSDTQKIDHREQNRGEPSHERVGTAGIHSEQCLGSLLYEVKMLTVN